MRHLSTWLGLLGTLAVAGRPAPASAQPVGSEFQVNTYTTLLQQTFGDRLVAADADGNFVVVWQGRGAGDDYGVFGRRFDGAAVPLGSEFRVNADTTGRQGSPSVAREGRGNFVVVWASAYGTFGQRFEGSGQPLGTQFRVSSSSAPSYSASVASDQDGNFVVVWDASGESQTEVYGQRFDRGGRALGSEFRVNSYATDGQGVPSVAITDASGNFVVVWTSYGQDGQGVNALGVFGQRFDSQGAPQGEEFQVNTSTLGHQYQQSVAAGANGGFIVVWYSNNFGPYDVYGQRYDSAGVPQGAEFLVNSFTTGVQRGPSVASDGIGQFLVAWWESGAGDNVGVFGRFYDSDGMRRGAEFRLNSTTAGSQSAPSVGAIGIGDFIGVWKSTANQDGSRAGVFGIRVQPGTQNDVVGGPDTDNDGTVIVVNQP